MSEAAETIGFFVVIFVCVTLGVLLGFDSGNSAGHSRAMEEMCPKVLSYQPTLVDSLLVATKWKECLWLDAEAIDQ
jgi:hypothetical protein